MNHDIEITQLDLVEGGNVIRQGHHFTLGFTPRGENGDVVDLTGKNIHAVFYGKGEIRYEGPAEYVSADAVIRVSVNENIGHGTMWVEFTATDPNDATYKRKFPARESNTRINFNPSTDDLSFVGVKSITVEQLRNEQMVAQQEFESEVLPRVETVEGKQAQLEANYEAAAGALTEDSEVILARGDKPTLGARLDDTAVKLADTSRFITGISDFKIPAPSDFPIERIPFNLFYDSDEKIRHDYTPSIIGSSVFYSESTGLDTNDGLTLATPVKTLKKALDLANSLAASDVVINLMDKIYTRNTSAYSYDPAVSFQMNKNITLNSLHEQSYIGTIEKIGSGGISFTQDGTAWKAPRTSVRWVVDIKYKDEKGRPLTYKKAATLAECQQTQGSYFTDGTSVWIRRVKDELISGDEILIILNTVNLFIYTNGKHLMVKDISFFYNWDSNQQACLKLTGTPASKFTAINSSFCYGGGNGLETINIGLTLSFNSYAYYNGHDGFNYHEVPMTATPYSLAFEFDCKGYYNGQRTGRTQGINNGSTAHEGIYMLRIGTEAFGNDGPNIADVNGCYSVNFNCLAFNSVRPSNDGRKAGFIFSDEGSVKAGKAYLFNCSGGGKDTYAIGNQSNSVIFVRKFKGLNIEPTVLNALQYV